MKKKIKPIKYKKQRGGSDDQDWTMRPRPAHQTDKQAAKELTLSPPPSTKQIQFAERNKQNKEMNTRQAAKQAERELREKTQKQEMNTLQAARQAERELPAIIAHKVMDPLSVNNPLLKNLDPLNSSQQSVETTNDDLFNQKKKEISRIKFKEKIEIFFRMIAFIIQLATSAMGSMFIFLIIVLEICIAIFNTLEGGVRKNIVNPIRTFIPIKVKSGRITDRSWTILWKLVKKLFSLIS